MASIALGMLGGWLGGSSYGAIGMLIGSYAGQYLDSTYLFPPEGVSMEGPRLQDLKVQTATFGNPIKKLWGTQRLAGNLIFAEDIEEVETEEEVGGKGGGGGGEYTTYSYFGTFAVGICQGPIMFITRVWADTKLIYDVTGDQDGDLIQVDGLQWRYYLGGEIQIPDPTIAASVGITQATGFRGLSYAVFDRLPLEEFGNRIPQLTFEVVSDFTPTPTCRNIPDVVSTVWGSDTWVWMPDGLSFVGFAGGAVYWQRVNILSNSLELEKEIPDVPPYQCLHDIDELGIIHTLTGAGAGANNGRYIKMDGESLNQIDDAAFHAIFSCNQWAAHQMCVSKNPSHPWIMGARTLGGWYFYNRETMISPDGTAPSFNFAADTGVSKFLTVDSDNGVFFGTEAVHNCIPSTTRIVKFEIYNKTTLRLCSSDELACGDMLMYDRITNKLMIKNADNLSDGSRPCSFFDADDGSFLGHVYRADANKTVPPINWASTYRQGPINGYAYGESSWADFHKISFATQEVVEWWEPDCYPSGGGAIIYDPFSHAFWSNSTGGAYKILLDRGTRNPVKLSDIVTDICAACDLDATEIDVTDLLSTDVKGYTIENRMSGRAALKPLMDAYHFDGVESDGKLKFISRGSVPSVSIQEDDLASYAEGGSRPQELEISRRQEVELPSQVDVAFIDKETDYETGNLYARRIATNSVDTRTYRLPIVLSASEAKQIAEIHLGQIWYARDSYKIFLSRKYSYLDPADVVTVTEDSQSFVMRIERINYVGGILEIDGVADDPELYISSAVGTSGPDPGTVLAFPGPTVFHVLDIPLLTDQQVDPGVYYAAAGRLTGWRGALLMESDQAIVGFTAWQSVTSGAKIGFTTDVLAPFGYNIFDRGNTVNIRLNHPDLTLANATEAEVLDGANAVLIGDEVIQFTTRVEESDGSFTLSGLLRGRRGTSWAEDTHGAGERAIILSDDSGVSAPIYWSSMDFSTYYQQTKYYKGVSIGRLLNLGTVKELTFDFNATKPYPPTLDVEIKNIKIFEADSISYSGTCAANEKKVEKFTCSQTCKITRAVSYGRNTVSAAKSKAVIYADSTGSPGALLGTSGELVGWAPGWVNEYTFSTAVTLTEGVDYWVGIISDSSIQTYGDFGSGQCQENSDTYSDGPTDPFGTPSGDYYPPAMQLFTDNAVEIKWQRRARKYGAWQSDQDVPQIESSVIFDLEILDADGNVLRSLDETTETSYIWDRYLQDSDGRGSGTPFYFGFKVDDPFSLPNTSKAINNKYVSPWTLSYSGGPTNPKHDSLGVGTPGAPTELTFDRAQYATDDAVGIFKLVVYDDDGLGDPDALVGESAEGASALDTIVECSFSAAIDLTLGETYHIGAHIGGSSSVYGPYIYEIGQGSKNADTYSDGAADPFGTPSSESYVPMVWLATEKDYYDITIRVYQISDLVDRGFVEELNIRLWED